MSTPIALSPAELAANAAAAAKAVAAAKPASNAKPKRSALNDTAIHVLKAAFLSVIGPGCNVTQSVDYSHATKAELTVSYPGEETPSADQLKAISAKCNELIQANIPVSELQLPENELSSCEGPHTATTGELRLMKLLKGKLKKSQKGYQLEFYVHAAAEESVLKDAAAEAAKNSKKTQKVQQEAVAAKKGDKSPAAASSSSTSAAIKPATSDYIQDTTQSIFNDLIIPAVAKLQSSATTPSSSSTTSATSAPAASLTPAELASLKTTLLPQLETYLIMFANQAYTRGFTAKSTGTGDINLARLL